MTVPHAGTVLNEGEAQGRQGGDPRRRRADAEGESAGGGGGGVPTRYERGEGGDAEGGRGGRH